MIISNIFMRDLHINLVRIAINGGMTNKDNLQTFMYFVLLSFRPLFTKGLFNYYVITLGTGGGGKKNK